MGQNANGYSDGLGTGICTPGATGISGGAPASGRGVYRTAGAPGTALDGIAPKYAVCIRVDTGVYHMNTGTLATNTWTVITLTP